MKSNDDTDHVDAKGPKALEPSPLLSGARIFAERGVYSLVWIDEDLFVTARYGRLATFIDVGDALLDVCLPLIGLDEEIRALKASPGRVIELPAVLIATPDGSVPRLNLTLFWHAEGSHYLMLLTRTVSSTSLESELSMQMRARLIAETEVAEKSRELARTNAELERVNRDLEDFAAIISHDLKSPLRALRYVAEDVTQLLDGGDIAGARRSLDEIGKRTRRMSDMMSALLDYASVGRKSEIAEPVATRQIVDDVVHSLAVPDGFRIGISGNWPELDTIAAALDLVLRNLVQNAIVHHDRRHGNIVIDARLGHNTLTIAVTDDGPGIDPAHHQAILLPFRSLNQRPGSSGMGLAFVNRTVTAIGGRLEVRSSPKDGRGTTFMLFWPKRLNCGGGKGP